jgi:putative ABC transport system permease protein
MSAVRGRFRVDIRRRWRAWLGLAVLIGLVGGAVTGLAAGARRTDSVYGRFLARSAPSDLLVLDTSALNPEAQIDLEAAAQLPGVAHTALVRGLFTLGGRVDGREIPPFQMAPFSGPVTGLGDTVERPLLLEGRLADPEAVDELVVSYEVARRLDLTPGSRVGLDMIRADRLLPAAAELLAGLVDRLAGRDPRPNDMAATAGAHRYWFTVVGVESSPMDFPPVPGTLQPIAYTTPAFDAAVGRTVAGSGILIVALEPGTAVEDYKAELEAANEGRDITYAGGGVDRFKSAQRSIHLQAQALWMLAALVAIAGALIIAQVLARQVVLESRDHATLRALGMTPRQLLQVGALRALTVAAAAGVLVVLLAVAVSPAFPVGTGAAAEPDPGVRVDVGAILVGALATAALTFVLSVVADRLRQIRVARPPRERARHLAWTGRLPLSLHLGGRLALDPGRGPTAVPVRSTLAALVAAVAAAALSVSFVASLDHLTHTPRLYGWAWDVQIGGLGVPDVSDVLTEGLQQNPAVENLAVGTISQLEVDGHRVDGYAVDDVQGSVSAALLEGRGPTGPDEIALGTVTLDEVGADVGDRVEVGAAGRTVEMEIVGRSVFPNLGDAGQLGRGARLTFAGLERIAPGSLRTVALVDLTEDSDKGEEIAALRRALDVYPLYEDQRPDDLVNFGGTGTFPLVVVATLLLVTAATLLHTLVSSIRRRRSDLAVLKTIGLSRRQISRTVGWQATVLAGAALVIGLPLGAVAGRLVWTLIAGRFGVPAEPVTPVGWLLALAAGVLVFANLVAWGPAWMARRTPPARVLRSE